MREILLTSSVLILALLALRRVFRQKISRRVQYALWGLVLVRLLIPVSLPGLDFSVLTVAEPVQASISTRLEAVPVFIGPAAPVLDAPLPQSRYPAAVEPTVPDTTPVARPSAAPAENTAPAAVDVLTLAEILDFVWLAGAAAMALWLLVSNLRFAAMLRRRRRPVYIPGCERRVYMVESGLASPCLFGVLRPAVYLTSAAMDSEESLRHVLAHEETHAKHLDPLWALLRGVCLAVYWFDPLVWIAASAAKTDCELACDEGAIRRLGEEERLAYGRTLLRLIPVRRLPGNPLLSATTMSSDKKRLRDRISRIAEKRETRKLALCAMALLTAAVCLATFAGRAEGRENHSSDMAAVRNGPISAARLRYFNEQFFNGGYDYYNINNQFLSSIYEDPADIDVFNLIYCGVPVEYGRDSGMPQPDWETILQEVCGGEEPGCAMYEINTATLDALLTDKMGITLAETNKTGMENFTYLPVYDTYFWAHGDTNYRPNVYFFAGVWEGDLIHLYYDETALDSLCTCVTLRETGEGGYQFVSNTFTEKPVIPTVYPEGEPLAVIPLTELTPYEPEKVEVTRHSGDCAERFIYQGHWLLASGERIQAYRSTDGNIYVAQIIDETPDGGWEADCFAVMPREDFTIEPFAGLFDQGGFAVSGYNEAAGMDATDYYYFEADGSLWRLAQVPGEIENVRIMDMDGDGTNELLAMDGFSGAGLVFRRDGRLYCADIAALLAEAVPEELIDYFGDIDPYARCLPAYVFAREERGIPLAITPTRRIYFDGENLLVYRQDKAAVDHVVKGIIASEDVLDTVRDATQVQMEYRLRNWEEEGLEDAQIDDWRIVGLDGPYYQQFEGGLLVRLYRFAYELHAAVPQNVVMAGGTYMDEGGWFGLGYAGYVGFILDEDGNWTHSFHNTTFNPEPTSDSFHAEVEQALLDAGLLDPTPAQDVQGVLDRIMQNDAVVLELRSPVKDNGWMKANSLRRYTVSPDEGNARNRQRWFTDPDTFTWSGAGDLPPAGDPALNAEKLTIASPNGDFALTFFSGSELVHCKNGELVRWFRAKNLTDPVDPFYDRSDIFNFMRQWFDEAEERDRRDAVVIPDDGRSREELALAWARAYEGSMLELTETNRYHCSYVDVRDVEIQTDYPHYPEYIGGREAFLFSYSVVFVPDDWRYHMAGNTEAYEGGDAPEGAFRYWRIAYMYLDEDGWRGYGPGTGP